MRAKPPAAVSLFENGRWEIWSPVQGPEITQHYVGLAMLEPHSLKWLAWQAIEPTKVKECKQEAQSDFNQQLGKALQMDQSTPKARAIAAHRSFLSYVALVIDVSLNEDNELTINEIHAALDCGFVVNPDRAKAQMEGGILYGLSLALLGEITVKNGAVVQSNFDDYPVLRIHQTPKKISTYFVEPSPEVVKDYPGEEVPPTGIGEPPTPAVAPALANSIVAAGGPRIRELPIRKTLQVL